MKISEAFDLYKEYITIKNQSRRLIETHEFVKKSFIEIMGDVNIGEIGMHNIYEWREAMSSRELKCGRKNERASNTIRCYILRVRAVFRHMKLIGEKCLDYELIPVPKRVDSKRDFLTSEEVEQMIQSAYNLRNKFVISLLYSSGIRLSELLGLNREDIIDGRFTVIGKGGKARICFIDDRTQQLMDEYLDSRKDSCEALVVSGLFKERMTATNIQLLVKNTANRAGIKKKVTPHILRHSFATNFMNNNGDIRPLSALLGHANLNTTAIYTHLVDNNLERQYRQFHTV